MATCEGANVFFNPDKPRGSGVARRRQLIAGHQMEVARLSGSVFESLDDCREACAYYPRPTNPADYLDPETLGVNSVGDTFWCRDTHLKIAAGVIGEKKGHFAAQVHCPFAAPSGGGLCTNVAVDSVQQHGYNASAYEFIRAGAESSRMLGYCQMYFNDLVADCTSAGIDDRTLNMAMALIPLETEIIILNNNVGKQDPVTGNTLGMGITMLESGTFQGIMNKDGIKSIIIDDGNIATVAEDTFHSLTNLESLSLNMQMISELPANLLSKAPDLREFSMYNARSAAKPGQLSSIPATFFTSAGLTQPKITRIVISGHKSLTEIPRNIFANLINLNTLILSNNGLTNRGVDEATFSTMYALQIWDMSMNQFSLVPAAWVNPSLLAANNGQRSEGWAWSLTHVYLQGNPITKVEDGIFENFTPNKCVLEVLLLHDTDLVTVPMNVFDMCQDSLISFSISPRA